MFTIFHEFSVDINASLEEVWEFAEYPKNWIIWNAMCRRPAILIVAQQLNPHPNILISLATLLFPVILGIREMPAILGC